MVSAKIIYVFKTERCVQVLHAGFEDKVNWTFCIRFDLIFNEQFWVFKLVETLKSWKEKNSSLEQSSKNSVAHCIRDFKRMRRFALSA